MKNLLFFSLTVVLTGIAMDNPMETQVKPIKVGTKRSAQEEIQPEAKAPRTESNAVVTTQIKASQTPSSPALNYYTQKNLEELSSKGIPRHAPCFILLDVKKTDLDLVLSERLTEAIRQMEYPIIVSTALLHHVVSRALDAENPSSQWKKRYGNLPLTFNNWNIHITPHSHFVILLPKKFSALFPDLGLKTSSNLNITKLLPGAQKGKEKIASLADFEEEISDFPQNWDDANFYSQFFKDFSRIFFTKNEFDQQKLPVWDILLLGHGISGTMPMIADLSPDNFNTLLSFFDSNLNVGTLLLVSCFSGGENLDLIQFERSGAERKHPYILIVSSSTDAPVPTYSEILLTFFNQAAFLNNKGASLNQFLTSIANISLSYYGVVEQMSRIPQVWLPNGMGFQTFNIEQYVLKLGNVTTRIATDEQQPIAIKDKMAVLLYPEIINSTVDIFLLPKEKNAPNGFVVTKSRFWDKLPMPEEYAFSQLITNMPKLFAFKKMFQSGEESSIFRDFIYPQFVSMLRGDSLQYIKKISLESGKGFSSGVIHLIRNSFLDIGQRTARKTFLIEELTGYNDISRILEAARLVKNNNQAHPLENILTNKKNQPITLKNVTVSSVYSWEKHQEAFEVAFIIDSSAWTFNSADLKDLWPKTFLWNFRPIDLKTYEESFSKVQQQLFTQKSETLPQPGQKTISETLKKKQEAIEIKKARESKQKEAAEQAIKKYKEIQRPQS